MSLSESTVNPCDYNPITRADYNHAVMAIGSLRRQGFHDAASVVEVAAKELQRRLEAGE